MELTTTVKTAIRSAAGRLYGHSPRFASDLAGKALILMYHRVIPRSEVASTFVQPGMFVTPETFDRHLRFLTAHFDVVSFAELLTRWRDGAWDPRARYCTITFDDGWLDNYQYAFPLLRKYGAPATIFLPTDLIGTSAWLWFDRLSHVLHRYGCVNGRLDVGVMDRIVERAKSLGEMARDDFICAIADEAGVALPESRRFIDWSEARDMSSHGLAFGSHTCTHAMLSRLDPASLDRELRRSREVLEEQDVASVPVLAYPNGDHDDAVVHAARAAGYQAAVTTNPGPESGRPADLLRLKRIGLHEDVTRSIPLFMFHIGCQVWPS